MIDYLKSILPRIMKYSYKLDHIEKLIDKPWIYINPDGQKEKFIFRRNNELLVSREGNITKGKWDFLEFDNSLIVEGDDFHYLLNQGFLFEEVMILKKDGEADNLFPLVNEIAIGNLDITKYLEERINKLESGETKISTEGRLAYLTEHLRKKKLRVTAIEINRDYQKVRTREGDEFEINTRRKYKLSKGDLITFHSVPAPEGKYLYNGWINFKVKNGSIIK